MTHMDDYDESLEDGNFKSEKRRYPITADEAFFSPTQEEPLFNPKALRQAYEDYVHQFPASAIKIGSFYDYLLRQCKPENEIKNALIKQQAYYERKLIELVDDSDNKIIAFAEYCANYGEKGPQGVWSEHHWQGDIMNSEPVLTTQELYEKFNQSRKISLWHTLNTSKEDAEIQPDK